MKSLARSVFPLVALAGVWACSGTTVDSALPDAGADTGPFADATGPDTGDLDATTPFDAAPEAETDAAPLPFVLTSAAFLDKATLPATYTCDGAGTSPPLAWSGVPKGTQELALVMSTMARDGKKWNWVLYRIPTTTRELATGETKVGTFGITSDGPNLAYSPPCSQGPGAKEYTFTLFALGAAASVPAQPSQVTGAALEEAASKALLASTSLTVSYTRP